VLALNVLSKDLADAWNLDCHSTAPGSGRCFIFSEWQKRKKKKDEEEKRKCLYMSILGETYFFHEDRWG